MTPQVVNATMRLSADTTDSQSVATNQTARTLFEHEFQLAVAAAITVKPPVQASRIRVTDVRGGDDEYEGRRMLAEGTSEDVALVVDFLIVPGPDNSSVSASILSSSLARPIQIQGLYSLSLDDVQNSVWACTQRCDAGEQDDDCNDGTPCVPCGPGYHSVDGIAPAGQCVQCPLGSTDDDNLASTVCKDCMPGFYARALRH